jgi:aspyridone synthetase trans-acting enoyl reductase
MIPITTCSPYSHALVRSLGAAETFDYHSPTCGSDIRAFTNTSMEYAFDCISDTRSMKICYTAIGNKGGKLVALDPYPARAVTRQDVKTEWIMLFTMFGKPVSWKKLFQRDSQPRDSEFAEDWFRVAQGLLDDRATIPQPIEERARGLEGIDGVGRVRRGKVSGTKLVYRIGN